MESQLKQHCESNALHWTVLDVFVSPIPADSPESKPVEVWMVLHRDSAVKQERHFSVQGFYFLVGGDGQQTKQNTQSDK